ncbi:hypothetical protein MMPV_006443 [Pyropia vietnamensis]
MKTKKRTRLVATAGPASVRLGNKASRPQHAEPLGEVIDQATDAVAGAAARDAERAKRRKLAEAAEARHAARASRSGGGGGGGGSRSAWSAGPPSSLRAKKAKAKAATAAGGGGSDEGDGGGDLDVDADGDGDDAAAGVLDASMTEKILRAAREQRDEDRTEEATTKAARRAHRQAAAAAHRQAWPTLGGGGGDDDGDVAGGGTGDSDGDTDSDGVSDGEADAGRWLGEAVNVSAAAAGAAGAADGASGDGDGGDDGYAYLDPDAITAEDEAALALFAGPAVASRRNLADIILEKIREKEAADARAAAAAAAAAAGEVDEAAAAAAAARREADAKIHTVYRAVGEVLAHYKSGKVPKAFKIIPSLKDWERVVLLTRPDTWSPAAVFVGTRMFVSALKPRGAERFLRNVLLPHVLEDIAANKRLNFHLYQALKKAVYKPEAFNKGILFPMVDDAATTTLREATIVASVLARVSLPMLHAAAALVHIAGRPYSGVASIFIRVLLDKKYSLPYRVVDEMVAHFCRATTDTRSMPVLWHQALLTLARRYKAVITAEQKGALKRLLRAHPHPGITPEVRRELFSSRSRGEVVDPDAASIAMEMADVVME